MFHYASAAAISAPLLIGAVLSAASPAMAADTDGSFICEHVFIGNNRQSADVRAWCKEGANGGRFAVFFNAIKQGWIDDSPLDAAQDQTYCRRNGIKSSTADPFQDCVNAVLARTTAAQKAEEYRAEKRIENQRKEDARVQADIDALAARRTAVDIRNVQTYDHCGLLA